MSGVSPSNIYSVFDYRQNKYHYFQAPLGDFPASGFFRPSRNGSSVAESFAPKIPTSARRIGEGAHARGVIATLDGLGGFDDVKKPAIAVGVFVLLAGAVFAARKMYDR